MASNDIARVKRNVSKMVDMGAPEADIDAYIDSEGVTIDDIKNFSPIKEQNNTPQVEQSPQSFTDQAIRTAGRGARALASGISSAADFVTLPVKTAIQGGIAGAEATGFIDEKKSKELTALNQTSMSDSVKGMIDENTGGYLKPQNPIERFADAVIEFATPMGIYGKVAQAVKPVTSTGKALKTVAELESSASKAGAIGSTIGYGTAQAIAPDSTAAAILLPLTMGMGTAGITQIPKAVTKVASTGLKTAKTVVNAAGDAVEQGISKVIEADLSKEIKSLDPAQRIIFQAIKAEGHDISTALELTKQAKEFGLDIPIFQTLDSPTLRAYSKTLTEFGGGAKTAKDAIKNLREKQIPESIDNLIKQIGSKGLSADENAAVMRQMSEDIISQALSEFKAQAAPLYREVLDNPQNLIPDGWYGDIKSRPVFQAAVARVVKKPSMQQYLGVSAQKLPDGTTQAAVSIPQNSMKFLDAVQKELETMASAAQAKSDPELGNFDAKIIGDTKRTLLEYMDEAFPRYKEARSIYSDDLKEVKALKDGPLGIIRDMSSGESRQASRKIFKLNPPQIRALRETFINSKLKGSEEAWNQGVAAYLEDAFEATRDGRNYRDVVFGNELQRQRLSAAIPQKAAQVERFFNVLDEAYKAGQLSGSDTASKQAAQAALGDGFSDFADVVNVITNPRAATLGFVRRAYQKSVIDDPDGARKMAQYLFTPEGEQLLQSLKEK